MSLLSEGQPRYTLRADSVFGYDNDDWLHTPLLPPEVSLGLTYEQMEETFKYFLLCSDRVGQVTRTYHDIKAVTHLLEEKERDLELAARIGQSLLKQNQELTARNERLDERLEMAKEEIAQLRHELSMRDDLLQFYASTEELENAESHSPIKRTESCGSLSSFIHYDFLQQKLKSLEDDNRKLRLEASELTTETSHYEEQEQELMMVCVEELSSVNKQVVDLSEELARKVEDSLRQQEEISSLLAQIVDLQARCKMLTHENEELSQNLGASRDSQLKLKSEMSFAHGSFAVSHTRELSSFLRGSMLYTYDRFSSRHSNIITKLTDDNSVSSVVDLVTSDDESAYKEEVQRLRPQPEAEQPLNKRDGDKLQKGQRKHFGPQLKDLQDKYSECEDMLHEAREDIKNLRNKSLPNSTVQRYTALTSVLPMDSLAAEIEGTFRKGLDNPAPSDYKNHPWRVFETVKVVNRAVRQRSRCNSPGLPGSSPVSTHSSCSSTPRTSYYGSDNTSFTSEDKPGYSHAQKEDNSGPKRLGQPGTPGGQDLEAALRSLSARQQNHSSERPFFDVERERKLHALASKCDEAESSSGFLTPNDSLVSSPAASTGTNYSNGSSRHSCGSSGGSRSYLPDRLQIVKPLEGSVTLHQWQQLAKPNLGGILHPRPGVLTKDFRELEVDMQHVYSLNDLEEDEPDLSHFSEVHGLVSSSGFNLPQTSPTHTITTCQVHRPSPPIPSFSTRLRSYSLPPCRNCELLSTSPPSHHQHIGPDIKTITTTTSALVTTSSLGLLRLLQERGISAAPHSHNKPNCSHTTAPSASKDSRKEGLLSADAGGHNLFSLNLVEKLQSLGLHRVAARGMSGHSEAERQKPSDGC